MGPEFLPGGRFVEVAAARPKSPFTERSQSGEMMEASPQQVATLGVLGGRATCRRPSSTTHPAGRGFTSALDQELDLSATDSSQPIRSRLDRMQAVVRIRWIDREHQIDLEFQRRIELDTLPAVGDNFVIQLGHASDRTVTAVIGMVGRLPIIVLNTIHADAELMPDRRNSPTEQMEEWNIGFSDTALPLT